MVVARRQRIALPIDRIDLGQRKRCFANSLQQYIQVGARYILLQLRRVAYYLCIQHSAIKRLLMHVKPLFFIIQTLIVQYFFSFCNYIVETCNNNEEYIIYNILMTLERVRARVP